MHNQGVTSFFLPCVSTCHPHDLHDLYVYMYVYIYVHTYVYHACMHVSMSSCVHAFMCSCPKRIHILRKKIAQLRTYVHSFHIHTFIHKYTHAYRYCAQAGESLVSIAESFSTDWLQIWAANAHLHNPHKLAGRHCVIFKGCDSAL